MIKVTLQELKTHVLVIEFIVVVKFIDGEQTRVGINTGSVERTCSERIGPWDVFMALHRPLGGWVANYAELRLVLLLVATIVWNRTTIF